MWVPILVLGKRKISSQVIIAIVVPILVSMVLVVVGIGFIRRRKARKNYNIAEERNVGDEMTHIGSLQFDFDTIEAATNYFSDDNKIGRGGFGEVYKFIYLFKHASVQFVHGI
ncbi:hypothetical protein HS088_TW21G00762 [Tripterygium wilfordii]|uniref:Uncharacterized protein n=1 Tax=Tripterygium wilfordii TaxID=458696 RepID=A0A7J7C390_TRIWF|nr:hypothetical protein HS088_TW21G00762 [Tripterygium wilfordii]